MIQMLEPMIRPVTLWAERSQRGACRNAMVATTALAERRRDHLEVAAYLDRALDRGSHRAGSAAPSLPAARLG
jgi:hypothetical protein